MLKIEPSVMDRSAPEIQSTFAGPSEMAARCRALDWSATELGAFDEWSPSLRTTAAMVVAAPFPMMLLWGPSYTQVYNDSYRPILGDAELSGLGRPARDCSPNAWRTHAHPCERVRAGESLVVEEAPYPSGSGEAASDDAWFTFGYSPVLDDARVIAGVLISATDATAIVLAKRAVVAANRAKGDFLAVMSHELRTPLNAIGGYAELLALGVRGAITPEQRDDLERIQQSQRHLLEIINGVLNYAKVDAGALHYKVEDVPMDELLGRCAALVATQAREKNVTLRFASCGTQLTARADGDKVQEIVLNLLSNAIKFTDVGGAVTLACASEENKRLVVRVSYTGQGIAASDMECVFLPSVQVDSKITRAQEGTGLGLAISRDLARGMGGELTVVSEVGEGSTFTLTLACGRGPMGDDTRHRRNGEGL